MARRAQQVSDVVALAPVSEPQRVALELNQRALWPASADEQPGPCWQRLCLLLDQAPESGLVLQLEQLAFSWLWSCSYQAGL
jgi:hypothetical protein